MMKSELCDFNLANMATTTSLSILRNSDDWMRWMGMIAGYSAELGIYGQITEGLIPAEFILGRTTLQWTDGEKEIYKILHQDSENEYKEYERHHEIQPIQDFFSHCGEV